MILEVRVPREVQPSHILSHLSPHSTSFHVIPSPSHRLPPCPQDISDEFEQIQGKLFNAKPHWGKNRDVAFDNLTEKYPKLPIFLRIR